MLQSQNDGSLVPTPTNSTLTFSNFQTPIPQINLPELKRISSQLGGMTPSSEKLNDGDKIIIITRDNKEIFTTIFPATNPLANPKEFINYAINICGVRGSEITVGLLNKKS